ncbi:MAG: MCE family protein [Dehalococcoidia bacterium]|nr:MCE family protein [Dehalococcoidia bacterium]
MGKIGILFVAALAIVLYFAFTLGGPGGIRFTGEMRTVRIQFDQVVGLKVKNDVLVSGVRQGAVTGFELQNDGRVIVICRIEAGSSLFDDATAEMINTSALGGKAIAITPGNARSGLIKPSTILRGTYVPDFLTEAGRAMGKVNTGLDGLISVIDDVRLLIADIKQGQGVVGSLLRDQQMADNLRQTFANLADASASARNITQEADTLMSQLNSGRGTLSGLIYDDQLADDVKRTVENARLTSEDARELARELRLVVSKVEQGEGIISALLNDPAMKDDVKNALGEADDALKEVKRAFAQADTLLTNVNAGKGSAGKFFTDDALYNDLVRAVNTLQAGFEDIREQAPVTAFASVLFQALQ